MGNNTCICCGEIIPEGIMVCPLCEKLRTSRHPRSDLYIAERNKGMTHQQIADKFGVSRQTVAQACARYSPNRFRPYTEKEVVYPNLRKWLNDNKVCRSEFCRRLGIVGFGTAYPNLGGWFSGVRYPNKTNIDKILSITGLTYEELWQTEVASDVLMRPVEEDA